MTVLGCDTGDKLYAMDRRAFLTASLLLLQTGPAPGAPVAPLRFGLTPVILDDQIDFLDRWRRYLQQHLRRPLRFVQRGTYREITELLLREELDVAWICGYPYVRESERLGLIAVPLYQGRPLYRSYLIASAEDTAIHGWRDLSGKVFAYSDPGSNSGYLYPRYAMNRLGLSPRGLFRRSFFTWAHRDVVRAVAEGLADAGAVDGYVYETLAKYHPELVGRTRVVLRSGPFGFPPVVARRNLAEATVKALRTALLRMNEEGVGRLLLRQLNLDGFSVQPSALFDDIEHMHRVLLQEGAL